MIQLSEALRNARLDLIAAAIDGASAPGRLLLYSGSRPNAGAAMTTQTLLVAITLPRPLAAPAQGGVLTLAPVAETLASASGIAAWARIVNGDGLWLADASVGEVGSGADVEIDALELYRGGAVNVLAASLSE